MSNKFNIHWQVARVNARGIKDPVEKLEYVIRFLDDNPNINNYDRVLNWVVMTGIAYPQPTRGLFEEAADMLRAEKANYQQEEDMDNDLDTVPHEDLERVYQDLSKRKYGFQFKSTPIAHIQFMERLKNYLKK